MSHRGSIRARRRRKLRKTREQARKRALTALAEQAGADGALGHGAYVKLTSFGFVRSGA